MACKVYIARKSLLKTQTMKKVLFVAAIAIAVLIANQAHAQKDDKQFSFGFGIEGGPIMGDKSFKEVFGSEVGLSIRFSYKVGPGYVTFTPGGLLVLPKSVSENDASVSVGTHVPLKLGYKYIIGKFFVMAEGGYAFHTVYTVDQDSQDINDAVKQRGGGLTYAPSVGANFGVFEVGVRYEATMLKIEGVKYTPSMVALRLGFNF